MNAHHPMIQFARYAVVGLASNAVLFLAYLAVTWLGMGPKLAMTLLYAIGVMQTFLFNKQWTFGHRASHRTAFLRYCLAYGMGYAVNFLAMVLFVDRWGYPHQVVQGVMVLVLAILLFLLQKFWVFRPMAASG